MIASASEAPGIFRNPQCYLLGFSFVPLALSASAFTLFSCNLRANAKCLYGVMEIDKSVKILCQKWHQRIIYLIITATKWRFAKSYMAILIFPNNLADLF